MASVSIDLCPETACLSSGNKGTENVLVMALDQVLADDSFKVNSPKTIEARKSAETLLTWCMDSKNKDRLKKFTRQWEHSLKEVIISSGAKRLWSYNYDKLWRGFFKLRSAPDFVSKWTNFLEPVAGRVKPVLFQHLTDLVFKKFLNDHFQVLHLDQQDSAELTESEKGALWYITGYICRQLRKRLERESHEFKEEMFICLMEMIKKSDDKDEMHGDDEEWTELIDRGGHTLACQRNNIPIFCAVEYAVREVLKKLLKPSPPSKVEMVQKITGDDNVQFYWLIVTADFEIDDQTSHATLLNMIVELFCTVRGFSLASVWLEKYKQCTKKPTQRSKSLRRDLHDFTTTV